MSVNNYKPHVVILPEDEADRQIANGFLRFPDVKGFMNVRILPPAGGWSAVRDSFEREHNSAMRRFPKRIMVLIVDFDGRGDQRRREVLSLVDAEIADRVFVLGASGEPEELRASLGKKLDEIGKALAKDCADGTVATWSHPLLAHNSDELDRACLDLKRILFLP